jgi:hypothetical protein
VVVATSSNTALPAALRFTQMPLVVGAARGTSATRITINAHCCAMRLQRRLSTTFAARGHSALRPDSMARTLQMEERGRWLIH